MENNILFKEDYLNLGEVRKEKIEYIVSSYLEKMENSERILEDPSDFLLVIAEAFPILNNQSKWLEETYKLISKVSDDILAGKYEYQPGLIVGACKIGFIIRLLYKRTNHYKKFLDTLDYYIISRLKVLVDLYEKQMSVLKTQHYDVIYGLSGSGIYLLECNSSKERDDILQHILIYFSKLILNFHKYQNVEVPNWHILCENHSMDDDRKYYSSGSFNFGVSHGIIGIYSFASSMFRKNIEKVRAKKIIDEIEAIYLKHSKLVNNCRYWPGRLKLEEFIGKESSYINYRQSWCYGPIGINTVFLKEAYLRSDNDLLQRMYDNMVEISKIPLEEYELNSPIICHGYAGALEMFITAQKILKSSAFHKKINELLDIVIDMYDSKALYGYRDISIKYNKNGEFQTVMKDGNSFLEGGSGIILVLLSSYIKNTEFQKILLL